MPALAEVIWVHAHARGMRGPKLSPRFNTEAVFMWVLHLQCQFAMEILDLSPGVTGNVRKWSPSLLPHLLGDAGATGAGFFGWKQVSLGSPFCGRVTWIWQQRKIKGSAPGYGDAGWGYTLEFGRGAKSP